MDSADHLNYATILPGGNREVNVPATPKNKTIDSEALTDPSSQVQERRDRSASNNLPCRGF